MKRKIVLCALMTVVLSLTTGLGVMAETGNTAPAGAAGQETEEKETGETAEEIRIEGAGFDTETEAAEAYIRGLTDWDLQQMLSACVVESYVDSYRMDKQIERIGVMQTPAGSGYMPLHNDFTRAMNIENRRSALVQIMKRQYLTLIGSPAVFEMSDRVMINMKDYESAEDMIEQIYPVTDTPQISFSGMFLPPALLTDRFYTSQNQYSMAWNAYIDGAQQLSSVCALIDVDGEYYVLTLGTERYGDKWYVTSLNVLGIILMLDSYNGGICSVYDVTGLTAEKTDTMYEQLFADGRAMELTQAVTEAIGSIDTEAIFALPEDEVKSAYEEAYMEAIGSSITEEDRQYIESLTNVLGF
ncbi:MAG: hypothetical protein J6P87_02200 [Lachnospiraceae bacterium]|nr:hypothetical protein [Lachnospiraceae bacterium]